MNKISFIIPAHNCANTIERAVKSILTLSVNLEIIIVENGSKDNTVDVVKRLANQYKNIHDISSDKGVSIARNKGIDAATGDWIIFVDADDECLQGIEKTSKYLNDNDLDLIIGSYKKDNDVISHNYRILNKVITNNEDIKSWLISRPTLRMQAWAKIYRAEFLKVNKLRFNEDLSYSEDSEFVIRTLIKAQKVVIADIPFYQYHSGTVSTMRSVVEGRTEKYITALEVAEADVEDEGKAIKRAFVDYVIAHINIIGVHDVFSCEIKETWRNRCRKMHYLMQERVIARTIKDFKFSINLQSIPVMLCKYRLIIFGGGIYYIRSLQNRIRYKRARIDNYTGK